MRLMEPVLLAFMLFSITLAGCLSDLEEGDEEIVLIVNTGQTNGTVVQSFTDGELVSTNNVTMIFDFSETYSDRELMSFGIDLLDGAAPTVVDAKTDSTISIDFSNHGMYEIIAFATDERNQTQNMPIYIIIEMRIDWMEYSTYEPQPMTINPIPTNGGTSPSSIIIDSRVENPELIEDVSSGREVEITWSLVDSAEDACQTRSGLVHDGESVVWETIHFNTFLVHELRINYDSGQDYINVNQSVLIEYDDEIG